MKGIEQALARLLQLEPSAITAVEPVHAGVSWRVQVADADGRRLVLARTASTEDAENHIAVLEALARAGYAAVPQLLAFDGAFAVETFADGLTALQIVPSAPALEAAVDAIAALHSLRTREGLRWEVPPAAPIPAGDLPLYRLGFAAHERDPAREALAAAHEALLAAPFGFVHGSLHAGHVVFTANRPVLVELGRAGFGAQLFDVAAFLATAGLDPVVRTELAGRYCAATGVRTISPDLIDLATLPWGLDWLIELPRRQIVALGDDAATAELSLLAARVHEALRQPAGRHPAAVAIRAALWGG